MLYSAEINKAIKLMFAAHKEQLDKNGLPYVFHPFHVAEQMQDEDCVIAALLHDIIEDTDMTADDLRAQGFSDRVVDAVVLLTHTENDDYGEYIRNIKKNPIARAVKLADLRHNSDLSRLETVTDKDLARAGRYRRAIEELTGQE